jgi:hypothetical protein
VTISFSKQGLCFLEFVELDTLETSRITKVIQENLQRAIDVLQNWVHFLFLKETLQYLAVQEVAPWQ